MVRKERVQALRPYGKMIKLGGFVGVKNKCWGRGVSHTPISGTHPNFINPNVRYFTQKLPNAIAFPPK